MCRFIGLPDQRKKIGSNENDIEDHDKRYMIHSVSGLRSSIMLQSESQSRGEEDVVLELGQCGV